MSILTWILKTNEDMSRKNTKQVKIGKYTVSSHAQNRIVQKERNLNKRDMLQNLYGRSIQSKDYYHSDGKTLQYDRLNKNNQTITHITKKGNVVKTIRKYHKHNESKEMKKLGGKR